jgi:predicted MFS family arabinose efflux permease
MFSSLKIRDFRIYWAGMLVSLVGSWIQTVAQSWLIFDLTKSVFLLGLAGFLGSIPVFLFSLFGGVAADRVNKRSILLLTQNAFMALAFLLAILTQLKFITPWQVMFIALLNGTVMAFDAPSRQAIVAELVGREHLLNAVALNSAAFNSSRLIGPALAGMLIATVGMSGCFYVNGISFLAVIAALIFIKIPPGSKKESNKTFIKDLLEGLYFVRDHRTILLLITTVGITSLFGISYVILMPVFANDILKVGVKGLGMLMSASGLGALVAALLLARLGKYRNKGRLLVFSLAVFSASLVIFALSKIYLLSLAALALTGWSSVTAMSLVNTSLQELVPDNFRGRVMSAFMFTFAGIMPFGNLLAGTLSQFWGVTFTVALSGLICAVSFLVINILYPEIRSI